MTTLKEKLEDIKSSNHKGYGNSDILRLVAALDKAVEQRNDWGCGVAGSSENQMQDDADLLAILEGAE